MPLILNTGPTVEPITLDEAKDFLRVDGAYEDDLISSLITSARMHVETLLDKKLITQNWSLFLSEWPNTKDITIPSGPVQSINQIKLHNDQGGHTVWDSSNYETDLLSEPASLQRKTTWPSLERSANAIEIDLTIGYGPTPETTPAPLRQAIRMLVAQWFEMRAPEIEHHGSLPTPGAVLGLLSPYKSVRM